MGVGDIPVDLAEGGLLESDVATGSGQRTRIVTERLGAGDHLVHEGQRGGIEHKAGGRRNGLALGVLVTEGEEEAILEDRAAQAVIVTALGKDFLGAGAGILAAVALVRGLVTGGSGERVGAALGDGIDEGAGKIGAAHIVGIQLDVDGRQGFQRNRTAEGGDAVAVEAEGIVRLDAVDEERIEAKILALGAKLAALIEGTQREARIEPGDVLHVVADGGDVLDFGIVEAGSGAHAPCAKVRLAFAGDREGIQFDHIGTEGDGQLEGLTEVQVNILAGIGLHALSGGRDRVGTADAQAGEVKLTVGARDRRSTRAGRLVHHGNRGPRDGLALLVDDVAAERGRRDALTEQGAHGGKTEGENSAQHSFHGHRSFHSHLSLSSDWSVRARVAGH